MRIEVRNLSFSYGAHRVLNNISFSVEEGELLAILGPNGVGKSTLFRCMLGLLDNYNGKTFIDGKNIRDYTANELAQHIAYIPQSHYPSFNFSVFDMVLLGTTSQVYKFSTPGKKQKDLAMNALETLGIADLADRGYTNISGGERQLVLIARAIAQEAKILFMDEPTANLDYGHQLRAMKQVRALADSGYTILETTHSPDHAFLYADRILSIHNGTKLAHGTPKETITTELISKLYNVDVDIQSIKNDAVRVCVPRYIGE